jgi:hypothetical protein
MVHLPHLPTKNPENKPMPSEPLFSDFDDIAVAENVAESKR